MIIKYKLKPWRTVASLQIRSHALKVKDEMKILVVNEGVLLFKIAIAR